MVGAARLWRAGGATKHKLFRQLLASAPDRSPLDIGYPARLHNSLSLQGIFTGEGKGTTTDEVHVSSFFLVEKGPTADATDAPQPWGFLCNPVMKMTMTMIIFVLFLVMEHRRNEIDRGKPKYSGKKPVPLPLCPPQIPHGLSRDRTRGSAVGGRRLTAWAMARPVRVSNNHHWICTVYCVWRNITTSTNYAQMTSLQSNKFTSCLVQN
jgi:hypothetical protein